MSLPVSPKPCLPAMPACAAVRPWVRRSFAFFSVLVVLFPGGCDRQSTAPAISTDGSAAPHASEPLHQQADPSATRLYFHDVTSQAGIDWICRNGEDAGHFAILESLGGGVGVLDLDADGWPDVVLPGGGQFTGPDRTTVDGLPAGVFRNLGAFRFDDVTGPSSVDGSRYYTHGVAVSDMNNDGFADFVLTGFGGLQVFQNLGDGTFEELLPAETGLTDPLWSSSAAFGDFNSDGSPDLYVAHYVDWSFDNHPLCTAGQAGQRDVCPPRDFSPLPDTFYLNQQDGTFLDATRDWGLRPDGKGLGIVIGDIDLDGDLDVYVGNDTVPNFLYRNQGNGFEDAGLMSGTSVSDRGTADGSMGVDLGDFNRDGLPDLWVANYESEGFALYRNEGNCFFQPVSSPLGINAASGLYVGWGTVFLDADLDSDLDLFVSNGHVIRYPAVAPVRQKPLLFENHDGTRFVNVADHAGAYTSSPHMGRGLATADFDADGDQDLIINHTNEPVAILSNTTAESGNWLALRLIGTLSARDAHGTSIHLKLAGGRSMTTQIRSGSSYASSSDVEMIIGFGKASEVETLSIHWPSGIRQAVSVPAINSRYTVVEGAAASSRPGVAP